VRAKYIIGALIVVVFIVWGASAFLKTTIQYVSIDEAKTAERTVQVMGKIDFDKVNYNSDESRLEFAVYDAEAVDKASADNMNVVYYGVVPGNFDQATSVVLKGKPDGNEFVAEQMLVKCPSKYQGEGGDEYQDMKKHEEAIEGGADAAADGV
jgi:cytochrome c-type biogenesis protein CcmE